MKTQREIELSMYYGGVHRAEKMMRNAEEGGRAATNPYSKELLSDFVLPLAEALRIELDTRRVGRRAAHAQLLTGLDPEAVAFLAVRATINVCMQGQAVSMRKVGEAIGKTVHNELVLVQIAHDNPELFFTLARDMGRRMSKDERYRMTVYRMQAAKAGVEIIEWSQGSRHQVGLYLLGLLEAAGMVHIEELRIERGKHAAQDVTLSPDILDRIEQVRDYVATTMPVYGPCIEPPRDWTTMNDGGYHTNELRRSHYCLVRHAAGRLDMVRNSRPQIVFDAVNALQRTAWRVNERVLDTVLELAKHFSVGEVTSLAESPKPTAPAFLAEEWATRLPKDQWPDDKRTEFMKWKRTVHDWHVERKHMGVKYGRFYTATRSAQLYREFPSIYFVYFADSRGRLYPMTTGINPQGSDLQKALLTFSEGLPLNTPDAVRWFHVHGANKWGFDKATLAERHKWVVERQDLILAFAADPINNRGWTEADSPLQFLAWAFEYADWVNDNTGEFVSRIPVSMDGSCNGLQNLSAMLRDEIGGRATNLTNNEVMEDIYRRVAEAATVRMKAMTYEDAAKERLRQQWLTVGISRSLVKRSVMTTPYGVTRRSAIDYVIEDTFKKGNDCGFDKHEWMAAASVLMDSVWPAIGDIVVKGVECMAWLKKSARVIVNNMDKDAEPVISWISPSGFVAVQSYFEEKVHRINTKIAGETKIRLMSETDIPDVVRHASGLAPNFVHSMDAAHLHLTSSAAAARGITALAMIHDDYGTHAANSQALYETIREQFVRMYENYDPIAEFAAAYPCVSTPPAKGALDIAEVRKSAYFFS